MQVTIYTKDNCPQCDVVKAMIKIKSSKCDLSCISFEEMNSKNIDRIMALGIRSAPAIVDKSGEVLSVDEFLIELDKCCESN